MNGNLNTQLKLNRPAVPVGHYLEDSLFALLDIAPAPAQNSEARPPFNLVLVVDSSATMHHFHLSDEEREYWMGVAISRDELERGEADAVEAMYWKGQTLSEMQSAAQTPMQIAADAIKDLMTSLTPADKIAVFAFADHVHPVFNQQDWANFPEGCLTQMDLLRDNRLPIDIGTGTQMADALAQASRSLESHLSAQAINRLLVVSDGIVQDGEATLQVIDQIQSQGHAITTIGVGDEFDEEFLTRIADNSRGDYHYAANSAEITQKLTEEVSTLEATTVTDLYLAVRGLEGAVVQDIFLVRPAMTIFDEIHTDDGWMRARIGDVSSTALSSVLVQIASPLLPRGEHALIEAMLTWTSPGASATGSAGNARVLGSVNFTENPQQLAEINPEVQDLVDRFHVFKLEREAQRAQERGDLETAREKLGAATRQLHTLGEDSLAQEMEGQIADLGTVANSPRVKRLKATTRRLASSSPDSPVPQTE